MDKSCLIFDIVESSLACLLPLVRRARWSTRSTGCRLTRHQVGAAAELMTWTISTQITKLFAPMDSQSIDSHWDHGTTLLDNLGRVLANIEGTEARRTVEVDEKGDFLITTDERKTVVSECRLMKADLDVIMFIIRGWALTFEVVCWSEPNREWIVQDKKYCFWFSTN